MITRLLILPILALLACSSAANETTAGLVNTKDLHAPYDGLLARHVEAGAVDYAGLAKEAAVLDGYLAKVAIEDEAKLSRADRLAFWINAYNAFTLKLIIDQDKLPKSIRDLPSPWDTKKWKAAGRVLSLNNIEHEIIRKEFDEPRIHFALVCAARSCPDLRSEAYRGDRLEAQLADATARFLGNPKKGLFPGTHQDGPYVRISKLFDWYEQDFEGEDGKVLDFLAAHVGDDDQKWIEEHREDIRIEYLDYDWHLNVR